MHTIEFALPRVVLPLCHFIGNPGNQGYYLPEDGLNTENATWTVNYIILLKDFWKLPKVSLQIFSQLPNFNISGSFFS